MTEQYLIAHKVRGEPAFDVAEQMEVNGEIWWITHYGHRAYPFWYQALDHGLDNIIDCGIVGGPIPVMPEDCPEHFEVSAAPKGKGLKLGRGVLERLGLLKPTEPMTRRDW